jgi:hypothetical protein
MDNGKVSGRSSNALADNIGGGCQLNEQGKITKLLCEWDAKDVESIRKIVSKIPGLPTEGVYPMAKVDAEAYR